MPIDTSIYQTLKPVQFDPAGSAESAAKLSQLGLQMQTQQAMRDAYAQNIGPDGQLNRQGFISQLGRVNPQAAMQAGQSFVQMDKQKAEAQSAQYDAVDKKLSQVMPALEYLKQLPDDQARSSAWPGLKGNLSKQGIDTSMMSNDFSPDEFNTAYMNASMTKANLDKMKTQSEIQQTPAKIAETKFGRSSPNATISNQYDQDVKPIKVSQAAMNEMLDSYNHKTPQGDASLVLQNFKIRNPNVPGVDSIEEMLKSQSVGDEWKNKINKAINGGFDDNTRDNLIRDGMSAFRAQNQTFRGIQKKYLAKAKNQGVPNAEDIVSEPSIDQTLGQVNELSGKLGEFVPPTQREGSGGTLARFASNLINGKGQKADNDGVAYAAPVSGGISAHDAAALQWLKTADKTSKDTFDVRAKLKQKGLIK